MSAPQPPNQPWGGGQPSEGPPSGPQPQQDNPFASSEPTQVVQPGQTPTQGGGFGDTPEPTQVVQPGQPQEQALGGGDASGGESTQLVPPGMQPPPAIPYAPPPSAVDGLGASPQPGFGQPPGGFGQPQQLGQQPPAQFGQQPPPPGFGPPAQPGGFGGPPPGFGSPGGYGAPASGPAVKGSLFGWLAGGITAIISLVALIFTFTDLGDMSDYSTGYNEQPQVFDGLGLPSPGTLYFYLILIMVGAVVGLAAGALIALAGMLSAGIKKISPILAAAGGFLMLLFAILLMTAIPGTIGGQDVPSLGTPLLYLIVGIVVLIVGALGLFPQTAAFIGLGGGASANPAGFAPPPGGGFPGQPGGFAQPGQQPGQPGGYPGQPGGFGQPNPYGQPGGPNPASGGFGQPGQQPGQPPQW